MTDGELDEVYTALSQGLATVGEGSAALMLATLCLALIIERDDAGTVLPLIERAQRLCAV